MSKLFPKTWAAAVLLALGVTAAAQTANLQVPGYKNPIKRTDVENREEDESATARREALKQRFGGELTPEFAETLTREIERQRQLYPNQVVNKAGTTGTWKNIGPTNATRFQNGVTQASADSGRLRNILQDPNNPNTVYVLVGVGGLWKTTNFFASKPNWTALTDGIGTAGGGVAFGSTSNVLYYGTGDPVDWGVGGAVFHSTDGGQTWSAAIKLAGVTDIGTIAVEPHAGPTGGDVVLVGTNVGIYRSDDSGATYALASGVPTSNSVWSIVKTSAGWLASAKKGWFNGADPGQFYLSTNNGASWTALASTPSDIGRATLAVARPGDQIVYAFAANLDGSDQKDLYRSDDGGQTWSALNINSKTPVNPDPYTPNLDVMNGQAWYNQLLIVDPNDVARNTVYIGGNFSSAFTTDGGQSWRVMTSWLGSVKFTGYAPNQNPYVHADMHTGLVGTDGKGNKVIFIGSDGGIFYSVDNGKNFRDANEGLVTHMIYGLASTPARPDAVLIGLQDNGTRYRVSSTTTYNGSIGGDGFGVGWSQANNDISMGTLYYGDIRRFTQNPPNNQNKYEKVGIPDTGRGDEIFYTPLITPTAKVDPTGHVFFTATQSLIYRTDNAGTNWTPIFDLLTHTPPGAGYYLSYGPHIMNVSPTDGKQVAASAYYQIYFTKDGGTNWTTSNITPFAPNGYTGYAGNLAYSADNNYLYVASENRSPSNSTVRIAKRDMATGNWIAAGTGATGLPNVPVFKLAVDPNFKDGSHVFAGTWLGVYESKDGGQSWHLFGSGLPAAIVFDMYLFPDGSKIRIGTYGRGVWEMPLK